LRYTVSVSKKVYVGDRLLGEVFYSKEFDDSVTPAEAAFQAVKEQAEKWAGEIAHEWSGSAASNLTTPNLPKPAVRTVQDVAKVFPADLSSEVSIEAGDEVILVKPKHYLGTDKFRKISEIVKEFEGGAYVSAGRDSHWRIPKIATPPKTIGFIDEEPKIPEFNPADLMEHEGWKGRKLEDGSYAEGSLSWGWDFADNFPDSVIRVLEKSPLEIDQYVFSLTSSGNIVQTRRKKEG